MFEGEIPTYSVEPTEKERVWATMRRISELIRKNSKEGELGFYGESERFISLVVKTNTRGMFEGEEIITLVKNLPTKESIDFVAGKPNFSDLIAMPKDFVAVRVEIGQNRNTGEFFCYAAKIRHQRNSDYTSTGKTETIASFRESTATKPAKITTQEADQILANIEREIRVALEERSQRNRTKDTSKTPEGDDVIPSIEETLAFVQ